MSRRTLMVAFALVLALAGGCDRRRHGTLTFSTWGSLDEVETLKPLLAEFQRENPDVPLRLLHIPDEYPHKIRLLAAARRMPDVLFLNNQALAGFASRGVLRDLTPFLATDPVLRARDFYPQVLSALRYHGKLYAIPRDLSNLVIYYNKALFDAAHVPYPAANWTYADMVASAQKLTNASGQFGMGFSTSPLYWLPYLWSDGADVFDRRLTRCTLLEPRALGALHRYLDLRTRYHVAPTVAQVGNETMSQLFAQGKLAMMLDGRWVVPGFRKKLDFAWDVAPFPRGQAGSVVDADASGWGISASCPEPQKAWRLIRFLAGRRASAEFMRSGLIVPARRDVANSPAFLSGLPTSSHVFLDVIGTARPTQTPTSYDEISYELIDGLAPAWDGTEPLEQALPPVVQRIDALLREDDQ